MIAAVLAAVAVVAIGVKVVVAATRTPPRAGGTVDSSVLDTVPHPSATPTDAATDTSPPPASPPAPTALPSASPSAKPSASPHPAAIVPTAAVTVLNNSTIHRLAAEVAARIRALGFPVADVGNLTGRTAATTVYYAPGYLAQANLLARDLPGRQRVLPRYAGLPSHAPLTLVVTEDLPG